MTDRKPPRDPQTPPPLPPRLQVRPHAAAPSANVPSSPQSAPTARPEPRLDTVRPGVDRPEDRPRSLGRPDQRLAVRPTPATGRPAYDPNSPPVGRTSRSQPEPRRRSSAGRAGIALALILTIATGGGLAYLAYAPPVGLIRDQIIAQVKAKSGRDLTVAGPVKLTFTAGLALSMRDLTLSGPAGMTAQPLATVGELTANVKLWPLLWRQISIDSLVLRQPVINLRVDPKGKRTWDFAGGMPPQPLVEYAQAASSPATGAAAGLPDAVKDFVNNASDPDNPSPQVKARLARFEELTLGDVRIEGGTVNYRDDRTNTAAVATALDTTIALASLASPLEATGRLDFLGEPLTFKIKLASPKAIVEDRPAKLTLVINGAPLDFKYDGTLALRSAIAAEGAVAAKSASLRALAAWIGHELPPSSGYGPMSVAGTVSAAGPLYVVNLATAALDGATASGTLSIDTTTPRPKVAANLRLSELDLNRYSLAAAKAIPVKQAPVAAPSSAPAAKSIEDLIGNAPVQPPASGPQVKGYTKRAGWNTEPIELGALGALDLDAKLAIGKLLYRDLKAGSSLAAIVLQSKALKINLEDMQLYDGRGRAFLSIDANAEPPVAGGNLSLDGVAAAAILKDAADFELLAGTAKIFVALGAQGHSEADLIATASGKADIAFTNGAIVGYNIPATIRGLMQGQFTGLDRTPSEKTDFSDLTATFTIANGVASNNDLKLSGPVLRATGTGQIQLPAQSVDYTVRPKITIPGQAGISGALAGIDVPLRITGPWAKPNIGVDKVGVANAPKTIEAVKEVGRQIKENDRIKQIGSTLKGLLKDNPDGTKANAKSIIDKLLKKKETPPAN